MRFSANFGALIAKSVAFNSFGGEIRRMNLDRFDLAILDLVQQDNLRSHASLGEDVGLSASSVRRRLAAMRAAGVIVADVSLTDTSKRGLTFLTSVSFEREDPKAYAAFRAQMRDQPAVSQCYAVSGDMDFVLIVHAESPEAYESWGERTLMSNPAIRRYSTSVVWSRTKFTTRISPIATSET